VSPIAGQFYPAYVGIRVRQVLNQLPGAVTTPIVNEHDLAIRGDASIRYQAMQQSREAPSGFGQDLLLVKARRDYGQTRGGFLKTVRH